MKIEERMLRRNPEDLIEIGRCLGDFYNSPAGSILRAMINGRVNLEARDHLEDDRIKPSRVLGRIEAYNQIINDIELSISQYHSLIQPLPEDQSEEGQ